MLLIMECFSTLITMHTIKGFKLKMHDSVCMMVMIDADRIFKLIIRMLYLKINSMSIVRYILHELNVKHITCIYNCIINLLHI